MGTVLGAGEDLGSSQASKNERIERRESDMADVTVEQLAKAVGIPAERLLQQMQDAGLEHTTPSSLVTDEEKQKLLSFLKHSHGSSETTGKKITLKRKSLSTLKVSGSSGKSKTVNVEVRKKRTYIKRPIIDQSEAEAAPEEKAPEVDSPENTIDDTQASKTEPTANTTEAAEQAPIESTPEDSQSEASFDDAEKSPETLPSDANLSISSQHARKTAAVKEKAAVLTTTVKADKPTEKSTPKSKSTKKPEDEDRRKLEEKAKKEADERARSKTLENARRVAEELAARENSSSQETAEEDIVIEDEIVKQAFEESIEKEERQTKKSKSKSVDKKRLSITGKGKKLKLKGSGEHGFQSPTGPIVKEVKIPENILVSDLANQMSVKGTEVVKELFKMGIAATINQTIDQDTAVLVVEELGHKSVLVSADQLEDSLEALVSSEEGSELESRAPVVTIMGHVDHGKTSLLDYIRRTKVATGEAGGITQHIGAYHVETDQGMITFLDTPGHAAFTAMRARGAKCTDIVVLVVAADDGLMPQTEEAIQHAKAAEVPLVIAVNKIDKEDADPERVKNELSAKGVIPEDWGGDTQFVEVSAHTGQGIDSLLESILLQSEILELKSVRTGSARGVIIESSLDRGRGVVASLLVQSGELRTGDMILAGEHFGRIRVMHDENGQPINTAGPSIPVEILGLNGAPEAGEAFLIVPDEKKAKEVAQFRREKAWQKRLARQEATKLENIFDNLKKTEAAKVNIIVKADVRGSMEAIIGSLNELSTDEVSVSIVSSGVGGINESDANLAVTSNATIIGFNTRADVSAKRICSDEGIDIRYYSVIYDIIEDVKSAMSGLLAPERRESILGIAEVRQVFRSSKFGAAAGCMVVDGTIHRNKRIRVLRDNVVIYEGELESLRRFKEDLAEVRSGLECGIAVKSYNDIKEGDKIEVFDVKEIARTL